MPEDMINEILRQIAALPDVAKAKGGLVPLSPGAADKREGVVVHCVCTPPPITTAKDLLQWLRGQASLVVKVLRRSGYHREISMVGITIRLRERGENVVVYGCDLPGGRCEADNQVNVIPKEWSHDEAINEILRK